MKICQVHPGCGIPVPPPNWGAVEKIVWEFTQNLRLLGHEVDIKYANEIQPGEYDIVHVHMANLAISYMREISHTFTNYMITMLFTMVRILLFLKRI